jgi:hypothetical protein
MPFPLSPANNQTALVNGIVYQWNNTLGVWKRNGSINSASIGQLLLSSAQQSTTNGSGTLIVSGGAGITGNVYTGGIFITGAANGITFADGSTQTSSGASAATGAAAFAQANTAIAQANAAFNQANAANSLAGSAYGQANAAFNQANAANQYANSAFAKANTVANDLANFSSLFAGIEVTQNTRISNAETRTQAAFDAANSKFSSSGGTITGDTVVTGNLTITGATVYANTENLTVKDNIITLNSNVTGAPSLSAGIEVNRGSSTNTKLLWSEANTSWEFTNNGTTYEKIAGLTYVQAAFDKANTAEGSIGLAAFDKANSANVLAQAAFDQANAALALANTANTTASSGGSGGSSTSFTTYIDRFTGNGSQTEFTLSTIPDAENQTMVFLNGVYQNKDTYSISGANVVLTGTATANDTIEVSTFARVLNVDSSMYKTRIYQGDGSTTTFTISSGHTANTILLFNNGVAQFPVDDYTVGGTILTYVLPPGSDETIQIRELPLNTLVPSTQALMRRYTANGVQTQFTVTSGQTANSLLVFENGICQVPVNDYTVSGTILTFTTAPIANVVVQIRELSI